MRIEFIKNFATADECRELAQWALDHEGTALTEANMKVGGWRYRRTSRCSPRTYDLPDLAYRLQDRIRSLVSVPLRTAPNGGKDGIIIASTYPGGDTVEHIDPQPVPGVDVLRTNIIVQAAEVGGTLNVGGRDITPGVGDLHGYVVTRHLHSVGPVGGRIPRIIWLFGFLIDADAWEQGRIAINPAVSNPLAV